MDFIKKMDMCYSFKLVLPKYADKDGRLLVVDIGNCFMNFYETGRKRVKT